eukprot:m.106376 g.106376  ORF g.106376 m.106376 type:complete len:51 (+) comp12695_c0_seq1:1361-1513(+)
MFNGINQLADISGVQLDIAKRWGYDEEVTNSVSSELGLKAPVYESGQSKL